MLLIFDIVVKIPKYGYVIIILRYLQSAFLHNSPAKYITDQSARSCQRLVINKRIQNLEY